ncbi:MAG TPA: heme-copper oxidase subunit III [Phycisphaerae bacterium]|nr:heme-copper oxidase subunit III [Phycisphaerae bacterium]HOJ72556.1 heme-copper oxidase subunit III [Phycisphaerae bacterium]HPP25152.1 heme-copper oxidase subunit III [Phycisphaerae bacterium]HQA00705.1 heme-copper oxidase subunit III [Phycisphaerae bacterium]HQE26380.1 heme-copper oxidase subunit III [Phycisphaerae bacterium]
MDRSPEKPLDDRLPPDTGTFGLSLFLVSLSVLFAASLLAYGIIRSSAVGRGVSYGTLHVPSALWLSTAVILASSVSIHLALGAVRTGRQHTFRRAMVVTAILGLAFLIVQAPSLYRLLQSHEAFRDRNIYLYGLILMLIGLHALHVIGGLMPLGVVTGRALQGRYHAGRYEGVRYCAMYWHFLDVVWLFMFGVLWTMK